MDIHERNKLIADLQQLAKCQPGLPWWVMDLIRILDDVASDVIDLGRTTEMIEETQVAQQKTINGLTDRYSEVLYKLKSGD